VRSEPPPGVEGHRLPGALTTWMQTLSAPALRWVSTSRSMSASSPQAIRASTRRSLPDVISSSVKPSPPVVRVFHQSTSLPRVHFSIW
jgi:hypothetical protein